MPAQYQQALSSGTVSLTARDFSHSQIMPGSVTLNKDAQQVIIMLDLLYKDHEWNLK
jgi:hypothetical protein